MTWCNVNNGQRLTAGLYLLLMFYPSLSYAEGLIGFSGAGGSVSYGYGYTKVGDLESENTRLSVSANGAGYIWKPWFIRFNAGLSLGLTESVSSSGTGESTSETETGNAGFSIFPLSRFPFSLDYTRTDSLADTGSALSLGETRYQTYRIIARQSYFFEGGSRMQVSWNRSNFLTLDDEEERFESDSVNLSFNTQSEFHAISFIAGFAESRRSTDNAEPNSYNANINYSYTPGTDLTMTSLVSQSFTDNDSTVETARLETDITQVSTSFSWRPRHKSFSVSGSALASQFNTTGLAGKDTTDRMSLAISMGYRFSRRLILNTSLTGAISDTGETQTLSSNQNVGLSYNSEQSKLLGYHYTYGVGGGLSNAYTKFESESTVTTGDPETSQQSGQLNFNHRMSRSWLLGRGSSVSLGFSQGAGVSGSSESDQESTSINHGINTGWSNRGRGVSTLVSATLGDSRSFSDIDSTRQLLTIQLNRSQRISRISNFSANATIQDSRQETSDSPLTEFRSLSAGAKYQNSRAFGIYRMRSTLDVKYTISENVTAANSAVNEQGGTVDIRGKLEYTIGKLATSMGLRIMGEPGGGATNPSYGLTFNAVRSF